MATETKREYEPLNMVDDRPAWVQVLEARYSEINRSLYGEWDTDKRTALKAEGENILEKVKEYYDSLPDED